MKSSAIQHVYGLLLMASVSCYVCSASAQVIGSVTAGDALSVACRHYGRECTGNTEIVVTLVKEAHELPALTMITEAEKSHAARYLKNGPIWIVSVRLRNEWRIKGVNVLYVISASDGDVLLDRPMY